MSAAPSRRQLLKSSCSDNPNTPHTLSPVCHPLTHLLEGCRHGQLGGVPSIHAGAEGLDEALKHLSAQVPSDELLHTLLIACGW